MTREETSRLLTCAGHGPGMAWKIAVEAEKGDRVAVDWVAFVEENMKAGNFPTRLKEGRVNG